MRLASGTRLGPYEIISPVGAGGMGEVYLARDTKLGRTVALKILPPNFASNPHRMQRFLREAKAASSLNHPNILTIYEIAETEAIPMIAAEFIEGETLREHLTRKRMSTQESLDVAVQIASALAAAHTAGIIHRDIKPENIMLRPDGYVKVLDFGLAKIVEEPQGKDAEGARTLSQCVSEPGLVLGTTRYMSPEQARGEPVDARADIWSLGVVLYEMVAGAPPFEGSASTEIIALILMKDPPPLARFAREVPAELERIVMKALQKNQEERFQTAKDFLLDLKGLKRQLETQAELSRNQPSRMVRELGGARADHEVIAPAGKQPGGQRGDIATPLPSSLQGFMAEMKKHQAGIVISLIVLIVGVIVLYDYLERASLASIDSIAVLPFLNVVHDPDMEYFSDGITESTINSLSQIPHLAVIARSSVFRYKGEEVDPQVVGRKLSVRSVLTGRIIRQGNDLTISVELVDVRNNHHLWGDHYNRKLSDILAVQSEIAGDICEELRSTLTREQHQKVTRRYTENTEAYHLYLKGRYYWNKRTGDDVKRSLDYFRQAIALDPGYALAYAGLADAYIALPVYSDFPLNEALQRAKDAALKALAIDDTLAEAHTALAGSIGGENWYFKGAEGEFRRAIALNPNYATAHQWYAQFLSTMGRHAEAVTQIKQAQELDPLSLIIQTSVGSTFLKARQYDQAIEQLQKAIEMDKNFYRAHLYLGEACLGEGRYVDAIAEFQLASVLSGEEGPEGAAKRAAALNRAFESSGEKGYWQKRLDLLRERMNERHISPYQMAGVYARLGEKNKAVEWLQKAFAERDINFLNLKIDPQFDELRSDPRISHLIHQVDLPEWFEADSKTIVEKRLPATSGSSPAH